MRIRQKKHAKIAKEFAPTLTSKPLSSRFSPEGDRRQDTNKSRSEDLLTKLQRRAIDKTDNIDSSIYSTEDPNKIIQASQEDLLTANKDSETELLKVEDSEREKEQSAPSQARFSSSRDRSSNTMSIAGFQGTYQPLFVEINDVEQGLVPNCYFLNQMAALARSNPDAMDKYINPKENGVYEVTIFVNSQPNAKPVKSLKTSITLTLDDILPASNFGMSAFTKEGTINVNGKVELLLMLIEKAYATYKGTYDRSLWSKPNEAISKLTLNNSDIYKNDRFNDKQVANIINSSLEKQLEVITATPNMSEHSKEEAASINKGITERTTYKVTKIDPISLTISLQSSLGSAYDITNLPINEFRKFFREFRLRI
ncbi:MAG: C2 family cysteine protease [Prochloraceae cyanobacterium]|nr:C2 family cysteine protease [Prochloraceae cyanobacterium]